MVEKGEGGWKRALADVVEEQGFFVGACVVGWGGGWRDPVSVWKGCVPPAGLSNSQNTLHTTIPIHPAAYLDVGELRVDLREAHPRRAVRRQVLDVHVRVLQQDSHLREVDRSIG